MKTKTRRGKSSKNMGGFEYTPEALEDMKKSLRRQRDRYDRLCGPVTVTRVEDR